LYAGYGASHCFRDVTRHCRRLRFAAAIFFTIFAATLIERRHAPMLRMLIIVAYASPLTFFI